MCGGGGGGGSQVIPFNMAALAPFLPSVFKGPFNAQGAFANEKMIASKYPWITPPAGQFEGAQPGQFAGAGGGAGFAAPPNPQPPIPPTVVAGGGGGVNNPTGNFNPMQASGGMPNGMQPNNLQQILAVLMGQGGGSSAQWQTDPTPKASAPIPATNPILAALMAGISSGGQ